MASLAILGGGVMGEAILKRAIDRGIAEPTNVRVAEVLPQRREQLTKTYNVACFATASEAASSADTIVLAVKPQSVGDLFHELKGVQADQLVLSIMAGVTIETISAGLGHHKSIIRVMPNTPAQIGQGMSVWTATAGVTDAQKQTARELLTALGEEVYVAAEHYLDMATAVSGSGPAYIFLVLEALTDAAVHIGLSRDVAERLAMQTLHGSAHYARESKLHPAVLRNMVTSPGGTTTEALQVLEDGALRGLIMHAVEAAYLKAIALGQKESH